MRTSRVELLALSAGGDRRSEGDEVVLFLPIVRSRLASLSERAWMVAESSSGLAWSANPGNSGGRAGVGREIGPDAQWQR